MKKILIYLLLLNFCHSEITNTMIEESLISSFKQAGNNLVKSSESLIRRATNNPTPEQICFSKQLKLQQQSSKYWWNKRKENQKMIRILIKYNIDYQTILKQTKTKSINLIKLKKESCSEEYFNFALKRKKADNKISEENTILKRLMMSNNLTIIKKSDYKNIKTKEKRKIKKIKMEIIERKDLNEEMKQAILDVE